MEVEPTFMGNPSTSVAASPTSEQLSSTTSATSLSFTPARCLVVRKSLYSTAVIAITGIPFSRARSAASTGAMLFPELEMMIIQSSGVMRW